MRTLRLEIAKKELADSIAKLSVEEKAKLLSGLYEWACGVPLHPKTIEAWIAEGKQY